MKKRLLALTLVLGLLASPAALAAEGQTRLFETGHIDRGYEDIVRDLTALGARISRTEEMN